MNNQTRQTLIRAIIIGFTLTTFLILISNHSTQFSTREYNMITLSGVLLTVILMGIV